MIRCNYLCGSINVWFAEHDYKQYTMKKDTVYKIDLSMHKGQIQTAACGCPAGVGPTGKCKHISALGYALEEFYRIKKFAFAMVMYICTSKMKSATKT